MFHTKRHTQVDLLNGPIFRSMLQFAVPVFFSSVFQQLYNTMDTVIVGHVLGDTSLAAIGTATPVYDLLIGFALGLGNGLSIVTARSYGSGDNNLLKRSVAVSLVIGAGISLFITLLTRVALYPFLQLLHTPEEIIGEAYSYVSVITLYTGVMFAYNLCAGVLRAIGNSFMPLMFLIFSSVLNIGLDFLFIAGFDMGIQGAAVATVISQAVSVVLCAVYILKRAEILVPERGHFKAGKDLYKEMAAQGFSMGFMHSLVSAGSAILQVGINGLGYLTIAGHTAARKLCQFCLMPMTAMISAVNTLVSQNYGAGKAQRIRSAMKCAYLYNAYVAVGLTILLLIFAPDMVRIISGSDEPVILENGAMYLRVVAPFYFILGLINDTRTALQAIGQKLLPIISSIMELFGKILFVAVFIPRYQYMAVIFCEPVIWCFMAVELLVAFWLNPYIKGAKKRTKSNSAY
ncbi:MATE family efflux transporter [bacterium 1xD8-48]|jgi:putative MATE family efflux protein|nr:MATE family efflux transporter [Lachnospiraceae bacterium]MCI9327656.1 MATE family efflux transporter [Lachnospiraceae bacterium]NBJ96087.1 MATE family efflux transporter [bacterium 1xD8-48]